ncbi:putative disease resistance protein [Acorus calamus]|uniref:Disease resistance protein n=1 Tax=Acorus calamus TaxID=4465 RepID=A0AAV9CK08_ACOCL|nr:putative disease resistance protein [Acorus calamus]
MVQMVEKDFGYYFDICAHDTCRVHDLMRELAILKATQTRFLSTKPLTDARRLTICETAGKEEAAIGDQPIFENLRTILAFGTESKNPKSICNRSPRVRVLHASCCEIDNVHDFCRKHPHLRYLDVQFITIHGNVIKDISCLYHLQTLSISSVYGKAANISQLRNLRHLILKDTDIRLDGLCGAKNLQTLDGIRAGDWIESSLSKLTNLRTLKIDECKESHGKALAESLVRLKCLVTLHLDAGENIGLPSLCTLSSLVNLRGLQLEGPYLEISLFGPVPKSHEELPRHLSTLILSGVCDPKHYPIEMLGKLTCLRSLHISETSYYPRDDYEVWHMKHGDFPHLQILKLTCMKRLREWIIEDGALQQLHYLRISGCDELKMLPDGLRLISTLRKLSFMIRTGTPLEGRVEKETGDDWDKIKHVPLIDVEYQPQEISSW